MDRAEEGIVFFQYRRSESGADCAVPEQCEVIVEAPVTLTVNGEIWLSFMCTPVDLEAMAVGFLFNEGVIAGREEVASVRPCGSGDNVDVWLHHPVEPPARWRRTSGCTGGLTSVEGGLPAPRLGPMVISPEQVFSLAAELLEGQDLYRRTGGVHTSALSDGERILITADDIGRHNTLDKIAGRYLLEGLYLERKVILTTGRVSSEMLQKAARLGAAVVISRTSPSSLSIQMAGAWGITLIGYARRNRFNLYTHPERILAAA
jgi:FdhD protein